MRINGDTGNNAGVSDALQLQTRAVSVSAIHEASLSGEAFSWNAVSADIATTETALLVRNDSSSKKLVIEKLYVYSDVATAIDVHLVTATFTIAGTAVVGVCLNKSGATVADATAKTDETGNTQGDIIVTLHTPELTTSAESVGYDFNGSVILGQNQAIGVDIVADSAAFECTLVGYFL